MLLLYVKKTRKSEKYGIIEMHDVTSGKCFREMRTMVHKRYEHLRYKVGFNSKFMAIAEKNGEFRYKLNIYDLKAIKSKTIADDLLVYTFDINSCFINMDEIKIFHSGIHGMAIFNFGSFACLPYESKSVILSLPWRSVWRSKGVDEEPLEPVHHMEAYREVLKYFGELSMNCQSAMKTHSLNRHVDPRTFTFGDDFIGFRDDPEMTIFDKNMEEIYQEVNYKNIQISQSTHVSVIGKTIYLTDIATGKVIKEKKLRRDADELHFKAICWYVSIKFRNISMS
jgi:hypothetical protein